MAPLTTSSDALLEIRYAAAGLRVGENIAIDCPFCFGGRSKDKRTCNVGRTSQGAYVYICYRSGCGKKGWLSGGGMVERRKHLVEFVPRVFSRAIEDIPDDVACIYLSKYGIPPEIIRECVGWDSYSQRTVWKVASPHGAVRGYELRLVRPDGRPKTLHFRHSPDPWVGYTDAAYVYSGAIIASALDGEKPPLIVVEDSVSALKVGQFTRAASLMGTNLTLEKAQDLKRVSNNIILALDRDATEKARGIISRWALLLGGIRLLPLQKDMKYWTNHELEDVLGDTTRKTEGVLERTF